MNISKVLSVVDDVRLLTKTASGLPISESLKDLAVLLSNKIPWCMCGGLAVGVHARPRGTDDIDILIPSDAYLQQIYIITSTKFKKATDHMITHRQMGVGVDLVTPEFINVNADIINKAIGSAKSSMVGGISIPVVTREGLVATKLGRSKYQDLADVESVIKNGGKVDLSGYSLTNAQLETLKRIEELVEKEKGAQ